MTTLAECFANPKPKSKFIPYISLGDPTFELCVEWGMSIIEAGADILELGIPFSDPVADGPVIQASYKRALSGSFEMEKVLKTTAKIHQNYPQTPLVYLAYYNPIFRYGVKEFFQAAHQAGIRGLVIPDIPFDAREYDTIYTLAREQAIDLIHLITPATTNQRINKMKKYVGGFIYYVTSFGVTGERQSFSANLSERVNMVRQTLEIPVCAGFGISRPEQAREISAYADGIIIGSAVQRIIEKHSADPDQCNQQLAYYIRQVRSNIL